jgi:hypothetical protein
VNKMHIHLRRSALTEWGVISDSDTCGFGMKYSEGAPVHTLIVQIQAEGSELARDSMGMYVEIDGRGLYPGVLEFRYDPVKKDVTSVLPLERFAGVSILQVELPQLLEPEQHLVLKAIEWSFSSYQRRREQGSARMLGRLVERFGTLPPGVMQRVQAASLFHLQDIGLRLEVAETLDDIFGRRRKYVRRSGQPTA